MLMVLGLLAATVIFVGLLIYQFKFKHLIEVTRNIPSAPSLPLIGHGHYFIGQPPHKFIELFREFNEKYGNTFKLWLGPELNILMDDVKDVEVILGTMRFNDKADEYHALEPWLKEGLLVSRGHKWHKRRKAITPAFHFKILDQMIPMFEHESRGLVKNLQKELQQQSNNGFNLYDWVNLCTLDTVCGKHHN